MVMEWKDAGKSAVDLCECSLLLVTNGTVSKEVAEQFTAFCLLSYPSPYKLYIPLETGIHIRM